MSHSITEAKSNSKAAILPVFIFNRDHVFGSVIVVSADGLTMIKSPTSFVAESLTFLASFTKVESSL